MTDDRDEEIRKRIGMLRGLKRNRDGQLLALLCEDVLWLLNAGQVDRAKQILRKIVSMEPNYLM